MGKFKPFLFGTLAGAGVIFVALQYHVVQTHEGFRVVPRTPQHSLGLAFADIRNWDAARWSDRPELARALVANGSTDLVAGSIATDLVNSVTSDGPMDQLRGYLNNSARNGITQPDPLFDSPEFPGIQKDRDWINDRQPNDSFLPFPQAQGQNRTDLFAETSQPRTSVASKPIASFEDVFQPSAPAEDDFRRSPNNAVYNNRYSPEPSASGNSTPDEEAEMLEQFLFGEEPAQESARNTRSSQQPSARVGMFEDISGELESRADEALARARQGFQNEVNRSIEESGNSFGRFARDQVKSSLKDSVSSMFPTDDPAGTASAGLPPKPRLPAAIEALKNGFDPFID